VGDEIVSKVVAANATDLNQGINTALKYTPGSTSHKKLIAIAHYATVFSAQLTNDHIILTQQKPVYGNSLSAGHTDTPSGQAWVLANAAAILDAGTGDTKHMNILKHVVGEGKLESDLEKYSPQLVTTTGDTDHHTSIKQIQTDAENAYAQLSTVEQENAAGDPTTAEKDTLGYVGELRDGKRNGQGTFTYASGSKYTGEWRDDKKHGQGTFFYDNGAKYVGEFRDGQFHGQGTYTYADGRVKEGIWENNKFQGIREEVVEQPPAAAVAVEQPAAVAVEQPAAVAVEQPAAVAVEEVPKPVSKPAELKFKEYTDGEYMGYLKNDKPHGQGTYKYADGSHYVGSWSDGEHDGIGTYTYANGDIFMGNFQNGTRHGQGKFTYADGRVEEGIYQNGRLIEQRNKE